LTPRRPEARLAILCGTADAEPVLPEVAQVFNLCLSIVAANAFSPDVRLGSSVLDSLHGRCASCG